MSEPFLSERDIGRIQQQLEDLIRTNNSTNDTFSEIFDKLEGQGKSITFLEAVSKETDRRLSEHNGNIIKNSEGITKERDRRKDDINKEARDRSTFQEGLNGSARATKWFVIAMTLICMVVTAICAVITLAR